MRQDDDRGGVVGPDLRQHLVGPGDNELVRARNPLRRRELAARVGHDRLPADRLRGAAERLRRVDGAEDEQARRRPVDVGEDPPAVELEEPAPAALELRVADEPLLARLDVRQDDRALLARHEAEHPLEHRRVGHLDVDVDLAAAGQPDAQRLVVGDPVRQELGRHAAEHLPRGAVDLVLDAAAGDGAGELAALRDRELRAHRAWGRAPRRDDRREREPLAAAAPALDVRDDLFHDSILGSTIGR